MYISHVYYSSVRNLWHQNFLRMNKVLSSSTSPCPTCFVLVGHCVHPDVVQLAAGVVVQQRSKLHRQTLTLTTLTSHSHWACQSQQATPTGPVSHNKPLPPVEAAVLNIGFYIIVYLFTSSADVNKAVSFFPLFFWLVEPGTQNKPWKVNHWTGRSFSLDWEELPAGQVDSRSTSPEPSCRVLAPPDY